MSSRRKPRRRIIINDYSKCYNCKTDKIDDFVYCPECGFPQRGSDKQKLNFVLELKRKKSAIKKIGKNLQIVRGILFGIGALNLLFYVEADSFQMTLGIITSFIFFGLGMWTFKQPFTAVLTAVIFYVSINLYYATISLNIFLAGIIIKGAIVAMLMYCLLSIKKTEALKKEVWGYEK